MISIYDDTNIFIQSSEKRPYFASRCLEFEGCNNSADFWKLTKEGELIDDDRSSLYIETENGGEFNLWNMEGLSKEESYQKIVNSGGSLSEESMKRLGLFSITKAESNIGEEAFGRLAFNSYKVNDELGYFNPNSVAALAGTYGTLLGTRMTFSYNNSFTGEDSREQLSTQSESVDELAYGMNNVFKKDWRKGWNNTFGWDY